MCYQLHWRPLAVRHLRLLQQCQHQTDHPGLLRQGLSAQSVQLDPVLPNGLTGLKLSNYMSNPFTISNGTPQGSPLSPILSALYTASLLELANSWMHCDLTMYMDDRAIYATSATTTAATKSTIASFKDIL